MKLSTKSRYGTRAVIEIAKHNGDRAITRNDINKNQDIPKPYLENILLTLKNGGIIRTIRGPKGGYELTKESKNITLLEIVSAFEGSLAPVKCVDDPNNCSKSNSCPTRGAWTKLKQAQIEVLKNINIESLIIDENNLSILN